MGNAPSELSRVSVTSARPSGDLPEVPAKMTSCILPPRSDLTLCSPITQVRASTTLDLPDPLGPTTAQIPGSNLSVVGAAKDLKPLSVSDLRYTGVDPMSAFGESGEPAPGRLPRVHDHVDPPRGVPGTQPIEEPTTLVLGPLCHHVHPPVGLVARVAGQSQFECAAPGPPPEAHPLHVSVHPGHQADLIALGHEVSNPSSKSAPARRVRPTVHVASTDRRTPSSTRSAIARSSPVRSRWYVSCRRGYRSSSRSASPDTRTVAW